ncbi:MAG: GspH/FimT family pseudopilin [Cellvibrionaceae bacterium]
MNSSYAKHQKYSGDNVLIGGFTLIELMISIVIVAILSMIAGPYLFGFLNNQSMVAQSKRFKSSIEYSRQEATSRLIPVVMCGSDDGVSCLGTLNWDQGWIIFLDRNDDQNPDLGTNRCLPAEDCLLKVDDPVVQGWTLTGDQSWIGFMAEGERAGGSATTFRLCGIDALAVGDTTLSRTLSINASGASAIQIGTATCP